MKQQRFVVMIPLGLKKKLRTYAADQGVPMRAVMIHALEQILGTDWRDPEKPPPGTQVLFDPPELDLSLGYNRMSVTLDNGDDE